jgi:hypothetical protein
MMRRLLLPPVLVLAAAGCGSPHGTLINGGDLQRMEQADAAARANHPTGADGRPAPGAPDGAAGGRATGAGKLSPERSKQRDDLDDRTLKLARRREDQARALAELDGKRTRTGLEQASAEASELMAVQQADRDHQLAAENVDHFIKVEQVRRRAEDALDLKRNEDGLLETREELAQLEMMYKDSSLGDATAEIVLNRTRRRLKNAEDGYQLRSQRTDELLSITLPRDQQRLELELATKTVALDNSQRTRDAGRLSRAAALRDLDFEAKKLQRETADIEIEARRVQQDLDRFEHDLGSDHPAAPLAPGGNS